MNNHTKPLKYTFYIYLDILWNFETNPASQHPRRKQAKLQKVIAVLITVTLHHNFPKENMLKLWKVKAVPITTTW